MKKITWNNPSQIDSFTKKIVTEKIVDTIGKKQEVITFEVRAQDVRHAYMMNPGKYAHSFVSQFDMFGLKKESSVFTVRCSEIISYKNVKEW